MDTIGEWLDEMGDAAVASVEMNDDSLTFLRPSPPPTTQGIIHTPPGRYQTLLAAADSALDGLFFFKSSQRTNETSPMDKRLCYGMVWYGMVW